MPHPDKTQIADVIFSTVVHEGREGDVVTSADRDDFEYQFCTAAADKIYAMLDEEKEKP